MTLPPEAWTALNTIGLFGIGVVAFLNTKKQAEIGAKVEAVKEIVDGPLTLALRSNAELTKRLADLTGDHSDVQAAMKAKAVQDNRMEGKNEPTQK